MPQRYLGHLRLQDPGKVHGFAMPGKRHSLLDPASPLYNAPKYAEIEASKAENAGRWGALWASCGQGDFREGSCSASVCLMHSKKLKEAQKPERKV